MLSVIDTSILVDHRPARFCYNRMCRQKRIAQMTVTEQIQSRIVKLKPPQQKALLGFLETLETRPEVKPVRKKENGAHKAEISAAVRGIAGIWKDRTDLPKDPVKAVKALRARMWSRGRHV
jgi:hypothetical protein